MLAVADRRPEGHVEADALEVEERALLLDPGADILAIGRVGADQAVPAPLAVRLAVDRQHPPVGMMVGGPAIEDQAVVELHRDAVRVARVDDLADDVPPLEPLVLPADLGRIVEQPHVRHRVRHDRLGLRLRQHRDVLVDIEPREEPIVPVGDVHVDHGPAIGRGIPGLAATTRSGFPVHELAVPFTELDCSWLKAVSGYSPSTSHPLRYCRRTNWLASACW